MKGATKKYRQYNEESEEEESWSIPKRQAEVRWEKPVQPTTIRKERATMDRQLPIPLATPLATPAEIIIDKYKIIIDEREKLNARETAMSS